MHELFQVSRIIQIMFSVLWIFINVAAAGLAFYRFRTTASGLICGVVFLLFAFKGILFQIYMHLIIPAVAGGPAYYQIPEVISYLLAILLTLMLAVGIGFIPRSLRILSEKS